MTLSLNRLGIVITFCMLITGGLLLGNAATVVGQSFKPTKTPVRTPFVPAIDKAAFSTGKPFNYVSPSEGQSVRVNEWLNVCDSERLMPTFEGEIMKTANKEIAYQWQKLYRTVQNEYLEGNVLAAKIKIVNGFFNQWPYQSDPKNWHKNDYWSTPREFIEDSGDCEDFAIVKYFALRALGVPAASMAVVIVDDMTNKITHAILVVSDGNNFYTLDNSTNLIYQNSAHSNYAPHFFMNEQNMWTP